MKGMGDYTKMWGGILILVALAFVIASYGG